MQLAFFGGPVTTVDQLTARIVSTGTAIDAVTTAAVIKAARALMISSLMLSLLLGVYIDGSLEFEPFLLPVAFCASGTVRIVTQMREKVTLIV